MEVGRDVARRSLFGNLRASRTGRRYSFRELRPLAGLWTTTSLAVALLGCGCSFAHPTGPVLLHETRTGEVVAHQWVCALELWALDGGWTARVTPNSLYLELREGPCGATGDVLATSSTGALAAHLTVPWAGYHVRIGNPTDNAVGYSLVTAYFVPSE